MERSGVIHCYHVIMRLEEITTAVSDAINTLYLFVPNGSYIVAARRKAIRLNGYILLLCFDLSGLVRQASINPKAVPLSDNVPAVFGRGHRRFHRPLKPSDLEFHP